MIDEIRVENLALIRKATLEPAAGLTVLTGETGAGKTALLNALKLLLGDRASADMVRDGEAALSVSGRFFGVSRDEDGDEGVDGLVAVRRVGVDGRSRVSIDGDMASVGDLSHLIAPTVDLCGQHEHQQLMRPATHMGMLDAWIGEEAATARAAYDAAFSEVEAAQKALAETRERASAGLARIEDARFALKRIDEVAPKEGEYEELLAALGRAEHAESLALAANRAFELLGGDEGALDAIDAAAQSLEGASKHDPCLGGYASNLREAAYLVEDVVRATRDYRDGVDFDPDELERMQSRVSAFQGLMRAYGPRMEEVFETRKRSAELIALAEDSTGALEAAEIALRKAESHLGETARALHAVRATASPRFAEEVSANMARLEMGSARLLCACEMQEREAWTKGGPSKIEFMFQPGAGMQARPFARIASGGEASRVMLAIKVVLGALDKVDTLVFDEVDAGVGGATAVALASVLADLAKSHQLIVVTHLAQVAVRADKHYLVEKREGDCPETLLESLEGEGRVTEIARMLSGEITETSRAHAREMLQYPAV